MIALNEKGEETFLELLNRRLDELQMVWSADFDTGGRLELRPRPASLIDGLRLQMMTSLAGAIWRQCKGCNKRFAVGRNGKRYDSEYHTDACRFEANRRMKKVASAG